MKSKLGQNFLINRNIAIREVKYAEISSNDVVLEIGPGKGVITKLLAEKANKVIAIEIDKSLINLLKDELDDNVKLIHADALKVDFSKLPKFNKIVSNLPYQISSPITFKFLEQDFELAILIYQKEFAERLIAKPGCKNYSRLTVNTYYKAECTKIEDIARFCFYPVPKVDSSMIKLVPRKSPPFSLEDEKFFFDLTNKLFGNRRKKIKNVIKKKYHLSDINIPFADERIEKLSPEQISELSNYVYTTIK